MQKSRSGHEEKTDVFAEAYFLIVLGWQLNRPRLRPQMSHLACMFSLLFFRSSSTSNLSNNRIADIEEGTFEGAAGVNELILTSNRLENVHHRMLKGLGGLRTLWVYTHKHTHKHAHTLLHLHHLDRRFEYNSSSIHHL